MKMGEAKKLVIWLVRRIFADIIVGTKKDNDWILFPMFIFCISSKYSGKPQKLIIDLNRNDRFLLSQRFSWDCSRSWLSFVLLFYKNFLNCLSLIFSFFPSISLYSGSYFVYGHWKGGNTSILINYVFCFVFVIEISFHTLALF